MEGRYIRRFGRGSRSNQTLLPVRVSRLANMVSCWYCDLKTSFLNEPLFCFGHRYSRCLRVWVSVGLGFSLTALLGVILILLWDLGGAVHLYKGNDGLSSLLNGSLFGFSSSISGLIMSLPDIGYIFLASILSVFIHEVGHALAAASSKRATDYDSNLITLHGNQRSRVHGNDQGREELGIFDDGAAVLHGEGPRLEETVILPSSIKIEDVNDHAPASINHEEVVITSGSASPNVISQVIIPSSTPKYLVGNVT